MARTGAQRKIAQNPAGTGAQGELIRKAPQGHRLNGAGRRPRQNCRKTTAGAYTGWRSMAPKAKLYDINRSGAVWRPNRGYMYKLHCTCEAQKVGVHVGRGAPLCIPQGASGRQRQPRTAHHVPISCTLPPTLGQDAFSNAPVPVLQKGAFWR